MKPQTKNKGIINMDAVVKRADGSVENWGRLCHASQWDAIKYALRHPVTMFNRQRWRLKQWLRQSRTLA